MSSIYRKGRDGYYYYQTYIHNPETGKKDKRIFHSLSTKDQKEAEGKQSEYDNKYEKYYFGKENKQKISFLRNNMKTISTISGTVIITLLMMDLFNAKPDLKKVRTVKKEVFNKKEIETLEKIEKTNIQQESTNTGKKKDENKIKNVPLKEVKKPPHPKAIIPKYTVQRVDRLSGAFEQGKVYVTVDKSSSNESLKLLCEKLKKHYSEFSNIVICLYADNKAGKEMVNGSAPSISAVEKKKAWLAMYSYHPVEVNISTITPVGTWVLTKQLIPGE